MPWPDPITLTGQHVTLAPLSHDHLADLQAASGTGDMHKLWYTMIPGAAGMQAEITRRLALQDAGSMLPFTTLTPDGRAIGMTTYMNVDATNRRVEIGSTWLAIDAQRGPINTEAKRLMLAHAYHQEEDYGGVDETILRISKGEVLDETQ